MTDISAAHCYPVWLSFQTHGRQTTLKVPPSLWLGTALRQVLAHELWAGTTCLISGPDFNHLHNTLPCHTIPGTCVSDDVAEGCGSRPQPRCGWVAAQRTQESSLGPVAEFAWQEIHLFFLLLKYCDFIRLYYSINLAYPGREGLTSLQINSTFTNNSVFTTPVLGCSWSLKIHVRQAE